MKTKNAQLIFQKRYMVYLTEKERINFLNYMNGFEGIYYDKERFIKYIFHFESSSTVEFTGKKI
ncbi:MAG: hypothetical protein EA358_00530 [Flavobacteriales bacterium]|nr:MAG: hypothetical protein EA358_00530 [Flavobacteriales bacterium]